MIPDGDLIVLTADGVGLVLDATGGRLPAIVHWGAALGPMTAEQAAALATAAVPVIGSNNADVPPRLTLLPEHHTGWPGRPGLTGSRAGRQWSPAFTVTEILVDGESGHRLRHRGRGERGVPRRRRSGRAAAHPGRRVAAVRAGARAGRRDQPRGGALRARRPHPRPPGARRRRRAAGLRGPAQPGAGAAARRLPHRAAPAGEPQGRTGADSAYVLHAGPAGFGFAAGRVHAVHTAWSGNHVHYAERVSTGECVLGGGELLLPGEVRLGPRRDLHEPVALRRVRRRASTRSPAASTATCGPGRGRSRPSARSRSTCGRPSTSTTTATGCSTWPTARPRSGVERFVLDDGWFGARRDDRAGLGDWVVSAEVWPDGLHPLVDRVRELGMQFGLWFEPEMVNPDSDVARAHPEWIMSARPEWPVESRHQQVLNLGIPEAYEHVKGQMPGAARRVRHRLRQVGPQPRPRRGRHADRRRAARRARPDPGVLPAARRAPRSPSRPGDRVLLVGRRAGRPGGAGAHRPGVGVGQHRPARPAAHAALDRAAPAPGVPRLAHRLGPLARDRPPPRPGLPGGHGASSVTSASSGTSRRPPTTRSPS